ncbi:uncharacterized protein C2845_PM17G02100 [Panicum miliaceum]|uniref:Uncharacterized protein n=1 Tax=Panicum miliaceum TaxID=4540 RepID=A0A3L6PZS6_PANMI|nr:uncharacterized protein C2845_PM17G02100 [Panicum miliaceum]
MGSSTTATQTRTITSVSTPSSVTRSMSRRLLQQNLSTPTRAMTPVQTPSPMTRSQNILLEFEGSIEPVACEALSPTTFMEKGKSKKLKVVSTASTGPGSAPWGDYLGGEVHEDDDSGGGMSTGPHTRCLAESAS